MADTLPPLPEPSAWHCYWRGDNDSASWDQWHDASDPMPEKWDSEAPDEVTPHYTADQMHTYAAAAVAAERERCVQIALDAPMVEPPLDDDPPEVDTALKSIAVSIAARIRGLDPLPRHGQQAALDLKA